MKKRILAFLLQIALLAIVLCGCGGGTTGSGATSGSTGAKDGSIVVGIAQDLDDSLDPHRMVAAGTKEVLFNVFEGLVKPTPDGDLIPAVAESHTVSDDGTVYTFTLREGVKFHNGDTVTADDVVYSIERCADTKGGEPLVEAFSVVKAVEKKDEKTVEITLKAADGDFLSYLTAAIIPANYDKQETAPVGTGPFKFASRSAQESIVLEKFADYWGTPAHMNKVTFRIIENGDALVLALQSGSIDLCAHLTTTQLAQIQNRGYTVVESTMNLVQALYLNNAVKPFDDVRVRQALCYAVDKQMVLDLTADGHGAPIGSSMYPTFGKYFMDELTDYYTQNIEKAKQLLTDAGYPNGFTFTMTVPSNYQPHIDTAEVLKEQFKAIGVTAEIRLVEWEIWVSETYVGRQFESTLVGVDASNMTARALLERFTSTYGKNFINYNNPAYDDLFTKVLEERDDAKRTDLYKQMQRQLTETAANVYIQDLADFVAMRADLTGYAFYPMYVMDMAQIRYAD